MRLYAEVCGEDGKPWQIADANGRKSNVFFDGGAAAEPRKLRQTKVTPKDFEAFWKSRVAEVSAMPYEAKLKEIDSPTKGARPYSVALNCPRVFNNLGCPKRIVWVQGSTHGYVPPKPQKVVW